VYDILCKPEKWGNHKVLLMAYTKLLTQSTIELMNRKKTKEEKEGIERKKVRLEKKLERLRN
jgi:hypothetical protein